MSISDRLTECIIKYNAYDLAKAMIAISIAVDGTTKKEYPMSASGVKPHQN